MLSELSKFGDDVRGAEIALLFFGGHSAVVKGKTWLMPVNAVKNNIEATAIDLTSVFTAVSNTTVGLILIDACYESRVFSGGCTEISLPDNVLNRGGVILGYSTQPGVPVAPSKADHSVYAEALKKYMEVRGIGIYSMLSEVGLAVLEKTHSKQTPWITGTGIFGRHQSSYLP
jgi:hypothetical protein